MLPGEFASPKDEHRPEGTHLLWAASGHSSAPLPPDIHIHRGTELGLLLTGVEEVHYGSMVLTCRPGDVWLCSAYEPHGARLLRPPRHSIVLIFLPEFIGRETLGDLPWLTLFAVPPEDRPRVGTPELRRRVLEIGHVMRREIEQRRPRWESIVRLEALHLLTELSREWTVPAPAELARPAIVDGLDRILPALSLVHSLPWRKVGVAEAADACALGVSRFQALFRSTMGVSFGEFGLRARVTFAAHRLADTRRPISAVAAESGFVDGSHLHRHFVRLYGCTPAEYRERGRPAHAPAGAEGAPRASKEPHRSR